MFGQVLKWLRGLVVASPKEEALPTAGSDFWALAKALECAYAAKVLQEVDSWCRSNAGRSSMRHYRDGQWWMWMSYSQWQERYLPMLSESKVRRVIGKLRASGLLIGVEMEAGRPLWWRVDRDAVAALMPRITALPAASPRPKAAGGGGQNEQPPWSTGTAPLVNGDTIRESPDNQSDRQPVSPQSSKLAGRVDVVAPAADDDEIDEGSIEFQEAMRKATAKGAQFPRAYARRIVLNERSRAEPEAAGNKYTTGQFADFLERPEAAS